MEPRHARYPFLDGARAAVSEADVDLAELATAGRGPVLSRAVERVRNAIEAGVVGDQHPTPRVELLSYPLARVLVSLVDQPGLTRRYTEAEAATAHERFTADIEDETELRSVSSPGLSLEGLFREFELDDEVRRDAGDRRSTDRFDVGVGTYLDLAGGFDADRWRLVNRAVADGLVPVSRGELYELLREAVRRRVAEGLPLDVPDEIRDGLSDEVADLKARLADHDLSHDIDAVVPELFPPCMDALLERAGDDPLRAHSRFAIVTFLASIGMDTDEIVDRVAVEGGEDIVRRQVALLSDEGGGVYPPPSCSTMQAYGDCVNQDALCDRIGHPLEYYRRRLDGDDPESYASRVESQ